MTYAFHWEAEEEFLAAVEYYEENEPGLGLDFALEVDAAIQKVLAFPQSWPKVHAEIRRCRTRRFPYGILYAWEGTSVYVLAVMHLHREPGYWKHRLE